MDTEATEKRQEAAGDKDKRRRAAAGAVALFTSASMLVGGIFNPPAAPLDEEDFQPQVIYSEDDEDDLTGGGDGGDGGSGESDGSESAQAELEPEFADDEQRRRRGGLWQQVAALPFGLRLLALLPLAALCWGVWSLGGVLLGLFLSPVAAKALSFVLLLAVLLGGYALAGKLLFPGQPLKKILNKRSLTGLAIGALVLAAADLVLPFVWVEYSRVASAARALGVLVLLGGGVLGLGLRLNRRHRDKAQPETEEEALPEEAEEPEGPRPMSREEILALADSVSRRKAP